MMEEQDWYSSDSEEEDKAVYNYDSTKDSRNCGPRTSKHREKVRYIVYADIAIMLFLIIYVIITVGVHVIELHLNTKANIEGEVNYSNTEIKMVWMLELLFSIILRVLELLVDVHLLKATKRETHPAMARMRASRWFSLKAFTLIISAILLAILFVSPPENWAVNFRVEQVIFSTILAGRLFSLFVVYLFIEELQYISICVLSPLVSVPVTPKLEEAFAYSLRSQPSYNFQWNRALM